MEDGSYFGTMMVYKDMQTEWFLEQPIRRNMILPALQFIKTKPNSSVVSSIFLCAEDRVSVLGIV
jgi:phosphate acetyltransferase